MNPDNPQFGGVQSKKLISLEEHNNKAYNSQPVGGPPQPNGIACPQCGDELLDISPGMVLPTQPPQTYVACGSCGFQGHRNI